MWLKTRRLNALLAPLGAVIGGEASDGCVRGTFGGYSIRAHPHAGYPIAYLSGDSSLPPESVNMFQVTLAGVQGSRTWHCQSSAGGTLHDVASRFTSGRLLEHFPRGAFRFEGVDHLHESTERMGEKLVKRLGMPITANADPALQQRLVAGGLFDELDALRWGGHPYLPKAQFIPSARHLADQAGMTARMLERTRPALEERLSASGLPDFESLVEAKLREAEGQDPGRLVLDVEAGSAKLPSADRFRELLERATHIAQINAEANLQL
jgi:hypothetical protein